MPTTTPCALCESLGTVYVAQTGYGNHFPDAYDKLRKLGLNLQCDLLRCPSCDAVFFWEDHTQLFGSGNLDEEELIRLEETQAQVVRELLSLPNDSISASELLKRAYAVLTESVRSLVLSRLRNSRDGAFTQILPSLLDRLHETNDATLRSFLVSYCYDGTIRCREVLKLLEENPRPKNSQCEELAKYCRKSLGLSD